MSAVFEKVREVIVSNLDCDEDQVTMEASLIDDLGADSLDAVELNIAIEDVFDIRIPEEYLDSMKTVGDICARVEELSA